MVDPAAIFTAAVSNDGLNSDVFCSIPRSPGCNLLLLFWAWADFEMFAVPSGLHPVFFWWTTDTICPVLAWSNRDPAKATTTNPTGSGLITWTSPSTFHLKEESKFGRPDNRFGNGLYHRKMKDDPIAGEDSGYFLFYAGMVFAQIRGIFNSVENCCVSQTPILINTGYMELKSLRIQCSEYGSSSSKEFHEHWPIHSAQAGLQLPGWFAVVLQNK